MKTENVKLLAENFAKMEQFLLKYNEIGALIMQIESEEVEDLTEKVQERDDIIKEMDKVKSTCTELIDSFESEDSALIRGMLTGTNINQRISDELAPLQNTIVSLRSAQLQAAENDKALQAQFTSRTNEAKEQLVQLKNDKKKLDYYSSVNPTGKLGGSLDSSF
ncbi:MAG: hypothetical protein HDT46_07635 [Ruminococcaceae bacterium]|nr:hypothetical protein [Oscillospiraceae bacterium]